MSWQRILCHDIFIENQGEMQKLSNGHLLAQQVKFLQVNKNKSFGRHNLMVGSDHKATTYISTGVAEVDSKLGDIPGIPDGTVAEFCGESQSGKTYLAMKMAVEAQKRLALEKSDRRIAFFNVENTFYAPRAAAIGIDINNPNFEVWRDLETGEDWCDLIEAALASEEYLLIIVDFIKALIPRDEMDKSFTQDRKFAGHASLIERLMKKAMNIGSRSGTTGIMINQMRTTSVQRGLQTAYIEAGAGGKSMEYFTRTRLRIDRIKGDDGKIMAVGKTGEMEIVGGKSRMMVMKSTYGGANNTAVFPIMFGATEGNALAQFLFQLQRNTATKEYVIRQGHGAARMYKYVDKDTGEVVAEERLDWEFLQAVMTAPPPSKMPKTIKVSNAYEFFCNRLKIDEAGHQAILDKIHAYASGEITSDVSDEETEPIEEEIPQGNEDASSE